MNQMNGFYDKLGQSTPRGKKLLTGHSRRFRALMRKAKTPREVMDLQRMLSGELSCEASLRILHLQANALQKRR